MKKVLVTDLDGTLIYSKNKHIRLAKEHISLLKNYVDAGGKVIIATARGTNFSYQMEEDLGFKCDYVCYNGAYVEYKGKTIDESFIDSQIVYDLQSLIGDNCFQYAFVIQSKGNYMAAKVQGLNFFTFLSFKALRLFKKHFFNEKIMFSNKIFNSILASDKILSVGIYFLNKETQDIISDMIIRRFQDKLEINRVKRGLEITAKDVNKALGVKKILKLMKVKKEDVLVVGDDGNDLSLFEEFPDSLVMSSAAETVKEKAKKQIDDYGEIKNYLGENE